MRKALHGTTYIIDYISAVASYAFSEKCASVSYNDIHKIIKDVAIKAQIVQEIEAGKRYHDYRKKSEADENFMRDAADKTVSAMVIWGLIEKIPSIEKETKKVRKYRIKSILRTIGQETYQQHTYAARLLLFDRMLRSEKETAFNVEFFLRIRDSLSPSEVSSKFSLPNAGVIQWTALNLRTNFEISQPDFTLLTHWCKQVGLLNLLDPKSLEMPSPKEVYLTVWIASFAELVSFQKLKLEETIRDSYIDKNCAMILEFLKVPQDKGIAGHCLQTQDLMENKVVLQSLASPFSSDLLAICKKNYNQKFILNAKLADCEDIYFLLRKQVSLEDFIPTLVKTYDQLKAKFKTPYVWIAPLRSLCARSLQMTDKQFDDLLVQFYKMRPEAMEFSKAATGFFRRRVRIFEKPFKLYGQSFRMIRLVEEI